MILFFTCLILLGAGATAAGLVWPAVTILFSNYKFCRDFALTFIGCIATWIVFLVR